MVHFSKLVGATALALSTLVSANKMVKEIVISKRAAAARRGDYIADPALRPDSVIGKPQMCTDGTVTVGDITYECKDVDFLSFVAYKDMEIKNRVHNHEADAADIWGWESPTGKDVAIVTMDNGVALVDVTDPVHPCVLAKLPTNLYADIWADVKVADNTLYHVKDNRVGDPEENGETPDKPTPGLEIWDLLPFDKLNCHADGYVPLVKEADNVKSEHGRAHNLVINTETKRLYSVGTRASTCNEGMVVYDISERMDPEFIGCVGEDGYTHDAQCVIYTGPDTKYQGREICFNSNEDTVTIWDVTDIGKEGGEAVMVSRTYYENQAYSHQGWLNFDMTKFFSDDELDELCNSPNGGGYQSYCDRLVHSGLSGVLTTSTNIWNIESLENPVREHVYVSSLSSIDHNLYNWGQIHAKGFGGGPATKYYPDPNFIYMNNYMSGLRILDTHGNDSTKWKEAAFFDCNDGEDEVEFFGSWSGYLHPKSEAYSISSIELGLFVVRPRTIFSAEFPAAPATEETDGPLLPSGTVVGIMFAFAAVAGVALVVLIIQNKMALASASPKPEAAADAAAPVEEEKPVSTIKHYTEDEGAKQDI